MKSAPFIAEVDIDEVLYTVGYDYDEGEPPVYYPNESAYPGSPDSVDLLTVEPEPPDRETWDNIEEAVLDYHQTYCVRESERRDDDEPEFEYPENFA